MLRLHGTKPADLVLKVRLAYVATTYTPGCRYLSFASGDMEPIKRKVNVWPEEPREDWRSPYEEDRQRITPYSVLDRTDDSPRIDDSHSTDDSSGQQRREAFDWTINLEWTGAPYGCGFMLYSVPILTYNESSEAGKAGGLVIDNMAADVDRGSPPEKELPANVTLNCRWGGYDYTYRANQEIECAPEGNEEWGSYKIYNIKNIELKLNIKYVNSRSDM